MTNQISKIVIEVADEVRAGMDEHRAIVEIAAEYGVSENMLAARFNLAYPQGVKPFPSDEEMHRRRREAEQAEEARVRAENEALREFFADHSKRVGLERTLRRLGI